ncbi:MAG: S41 family peptidase [candidate division Zixibacteria bacterium]|nr:S41 family peptidase [candidate division Zixibacteria bacterium]
MSKYTKISFVLGLLLGLILIAAMVYTTRDGIIVNLSSLDQIASNISNRYVDQVSTQELKSAGIAGMLSILDPYSELLEARAYSGLLEETTGEFQGLGMEIIVRDNYLTIVSTLEGTPAHRAGLHPGDRVVKINGENSVGISSEEAVQRLRGEKGTVARLTVIRPSQPGQLEFSVPRDVIEIKAVPFYGLTRENIGYVRLKKFSENSSQEVAQALLELKKSNPQGIILDLRGNPGGLLNEAVLVAALFLDGKKLIMETKGQNPNLNQKFYSEGAAVEPDLPLAVLVSGGSASASEIVAGAIQDWDRGIIIGDTTFGKGMVQSILELKDGLALKLTTAKYLTPSGRSIQKNSNQPEGLPIPGSDTVDATESHIYFTNGGRPVTDVGGIVPDVVIPRIKISSLEQQLTGQGLFFDFAVEYVGQHPELHDNEHLDNFEVSDQIYRNFTAYLKVKNFTYHSDTRDMLDAFSSQAQAEFESDLLAQKLTGLEWLIEQEEERLLEHLKEEVKWSVKEAIVVNLQGEKARYQEIWFNLHPEIKKAGELINQPESYRSILAG